MCIRDSHKIADGKYQLKLNLEKFNKDEEFKVEGGKLTYKGNELNNKDLTNAILESTKGKVYIDSEKKEHPVTTTTAVSYTHLIAGPHKTIFDIEKNDLIGRKIRTMNHCYTCTAGSGSS